jgi:hypothetical protein
VWLRGTAPSGDELELEIAVQVVQEKGTTIHQLAARKILQELEEGTGYIASGSTVWTRSRILELLNGGLKGRGEGGGDIWARK